MSRNHHRKGLLKWLKAKAIWMTQLKKLIYLILDRIITKGRNEEKLLIARLISDCKLFISLILNFNKITIMKSFITFKVVILFTFFISILFFAENGKAQIFQRDILFGAANCIKQCFTQEPSWFYCTSSRNFGWCCPDSSRS